MLRRVSTATGSDQTMGRGCTTEWCRPAAAGTGLLLLALTSLGAGCAQAREPVQLVLGAVPGLVPADLPPMHLLLVLAGLLVSLLLTGIAWIATRRSSEEVAAIEAVRKSQMQLSGLISIAADAIISIDETGRITLFNDGAERIFGYARDEVLGRPLEMLMPERFRHAHGHHIERFGATPTNSRQMGERQEIRGLHKDGHEFPAEASISKLMVGGRRSFTVLLRDISQRLEREIALRLSEERLKLALQVGRTGLFEHDHRTDTYYWSPLMREILGVAPDAPANLAAYFALIPPPERGEIERQVPQAHAPQGTGDFAVEHRINRADGETRWVTVQARTEFEGEGAARQAVRTIGAVRDITERRTIEDELARSKAELEARVAERTSALAAETARRAEAQAALSRAQRMEAFGQLAGGIAHDFNNLLTVITGNQELLEMRLKEPKDLTLLKRSQEAAEMGARLTGRLLTFARRRQLEPTLLNLNEVVTGLVDLLRRTLGEPIALTTLLDAAPWIVRADASEVENAIVNLAINARDAMPGGGKLLIETANVTVDADDAVQDSRLPPGQYLRLSVSDTGHGMTADVLQHAFEPFFTTKPPGKGTGLGLSTIYGFVQQSGGTVTAYSEVGRGTTVNVYLPRAEGQGAAQAPQPAESTPPAAGETVLLVEDHPEVRQVAASRLEQLGYKVLEAESGPAAVEVLRRTPAIDLVFSDVVMAGGMSGFDVAQWVRENAPSTKVLLTSGYPGDILREETGTGPRPRILRKPYNRGALARALRQTLKG